MKKSVVIYIIIGALVFFGVQYIVVDKLVEYKVREEFAFQQAEQQKEQQLEQQKEQRQTERLTKARKQLINDRKQLADTEVELQVAQDDLDDLQSFRFLRSRAQKEEQLKEQHKKIQQLELLKGTLKIKVAQSKAKVAQLEKAEAAKEEAPTN